MYIYIKLIKILAIYIYIYIPVVAVFLAELFDKVVDDRGGGARRVTEGERLLPRQLAGEAPREAAGVAAALALQPLRALLLRQGQREEGVHAPVGLGQQLLVDAVVHHLEEAVQLAGRAHLPDNLAGVAGEVDERHVQLLRRVRGGALVLRPDELLRDVRPTAQLGRIEHELLLLLLCYRHHGPSTAS
jgi:hypothetical protein